MPTQTTIQTTAIPTTNNPSTKLILSLTIFNEHVDYIPYLIQFECVTRYSLENLTTGVHTDASRVHRHVMIIYNTNGEKAYKTLNKKCQTIWKQISLYDNMKLQVTFTYNNDGYKSNPRNSYDETCLMYPFKEYSHNNEIEYDFQKGFYEDELHDMREKAHRKWSKYLKDKQKDQEDKIAKENKKKQLYIYLEQHTQYMLTEPLTQHRTIKETIVLILKYKKEYDESFRIHDLKNIAVNFLWKYNRIGHEGILELINM